MKWRYLAMIIIGLVIAFIGVWINPEGNIPLQGTNGYNIMGEFISIIVSMGGMFLFAIGLIWGMIVDDENLIKL